AGSYQIIYLPSNSVTLSGANSHDPENNISGYKWTIVYAAGPFSIVNPNSVATQVTNLVEGDYIFNLEVTDSGNLKSTSQVLIRVDSPLPGNPISFNNLTWQANCSLIVNNIFSSIPQGQPFSVYVRPVYTDGVGGWELVKHQSIATP